MAIIPFLFFSLSTYAQSSGYINRAATAVVTNGKPILDPNLDNYTSKTTSGFGTNDVTNSEIGYKSVPSFSVEPYGDLRRGPNHLYSDFVPDGSNNGFYTYFDGTNLLFRFRVGSIMSGSKGYSVLLDTDGKFGASGPNADPNYIAATTGVNGNPGFEIEIVLETNFDIAVYNVDGTSTPTLIKSYTNWQDMSQVSIAGTTDNGDPDFFRDFYIPFSVLTASPFNLTTASSIRMSSTTVMAPKAAIGGPKSDIYGLNDNLYNNTNTEYEAYINSQSAFTFNDLKSTGTGISTVMCTAAPTVNSPINVGTVSISGTWSNSGNTNAAAKATITVYKNGTTVLGTLTNISSGSTWTLSSATVANTDVITATAAGTNESACQISNSVTVSSCNSTNRPSLPNITCTTFNKGIAGNNLNANWTVHVDNMSTSTMYNSVSNTTSATFGSSTAAPNWNFSGGCTTGNPLSGGSYKIYYTDNTNGSCSSEPVYVCYTGNGSSALAGSVTTPVITSPANAVITNGSKTISGTADANTSLNLYVNGTVKQTVTTSSTGTFTFSNLSLVNGQIVYITSELNTGTVTTSKCEAQTSKYTVSCYTTPPIITADNNNQITVSKPITGISSEVAGTAIKVYTSANTLVATTTVLIDGTWSTSNAGTTPATYNAAASTTYYATAQNGTCSVSISSGSVAAAAQTASTRCGTITGPVATAATSISGILGSAVASTTVNLYLDGTLIGTTTTGTTTWGPITVNSTINNTLYSSGVLTIGIQESGAQEVICSNSTTISCSPTPTAPIISPATTTVGQNKTITYTISNAVAGSFYGVADATTGASAANGVWATTNGNLSITTNVISGTGTHSLIVKSTSLSGVTMCSALSATAKVTITATLPVNLIDFRGWKQNNATSLQWITETEINIKHYEIEHSTTGFTFTTIGEVAAAGNSSRTTYNFIDENALATINYYRLKVVGNDGRFTYSKVIIMHDNEAGITVNAARPNPFTSDITISMLLTQNEKIKLELFDASGKQIRVKELDGLKGANTINFDNLKNLTGGLYLIKVSANGEVYQQKLIKANY